ncbi:MAG TPA: DUF4288 domain-containing protein [Ferruginibacter sp.]|nr:DUF4288 domain-containing protein [Ferruginibacter sp.]HPH92848.1 DUF4288 domain-containing protein [Ferruginibacter sp.]
MNWYLTKMVFRVMLAGREQPASFDEQLRIITASSKEEALQKAQQLGIAEETTVVNINNKQLIEWKFINVSSLYQLKELLDGAEICATTHEPDCAADYIEMVHAKAAHISNNDTLEILQLA